MNFALATLETKNCIWESLRRGETEEVIKERYNKVGTKIYFWKSAKDNKIVDITVKLNFRGEEVYA